MTSDGDEPMAPDLVLVDTNVWVYETNLLATPKSLAFLHFLRVASAKILFPEVIEQEVIINTEKLCREELGKAEKALRRLSFLAGKGYECPKASGFEGIASKRLCKLSDLLLRVPFSEIHARGALNRVLRSLPPSQHKQQEFKDSAVWELLLDLDKKYEKVTIVSSDGDFFEDAQKKNVLATLLKKESLEVGRTVDIYPSLDCFLAKYASAAALPYKEALVSSFVAQSSAELARYCESRGVETLDLIHTHLESYATDQSDKLSVTIQTTHRARVVEDSEVYRFPDELRIRVEGQFVFDVATGEVSSPNIDRIVPLTVEGNELRGKAVFLRVTESFVIKDRVM